MSDFIPATTGMSRVFLAEGRLRVDHAPEYFSCYRAQAVSKGFGDVTDIECPDPERPGAYIKIGQYQAGDERATVTLEGRYAVDLRSRMLQLGTKKCPLDVVIHFGDCEDLSDFNNFKKALYLVDAQLTSYDTEDLGSLQSEDTAPVNETVEVSARLIYDIISLTFAKKAEDIVTNEVLDVVICDEVSCGNCAEESGGCEKVFAVTKAAGGSPGTPPDVVFTLDGGLVWYAHDIDTLLTTEDPTGVHCVSGYLVVVSNDAGSESYVDLDELDGIQDPAFIEVTTGFVTGGEPNAIDSVGTKAFIVGDNGYIYQMTDPTSGVTVLDAGVATTSKLLDVDMLNRNFAVVVGNDGVIIVCEDGETWQLAESSPVGVGVPINAVLVLSKNIWLIGLSNGTLYYTLDGGENWTLKGFPGSGSGSVADLVKASDEVLYMSHTTAAGVGRVLASFDAGHSWVVLPQDVGLMPKADAFNALAACEADPELLVAVGLDDDGSDGIIVVGKM